MFPCLRQKRFRPRPRTVRPHSGFLGLQGRDFVNPVRETSEAIVGAITGSLSVPRTLLLGRYDDDGRFQYIGRTTSLARAAGAAIAGLLAAGQRGHPWTGWSFSAGWGSREKLNVTLVEP